MLPPPVLATIIYVGITRSNPSSLVYKHTLNLKILKSTYVRVGEDRLLERVTRSRFSVPSLVAVVATRRMNVKSQDSQLTMMTFLCAMLVCQMI